MREGGRIVSSFGVVGDFRGLKAANLGAARIFKA